MSNVSCAVPLWWQLGDPLVPKSSDTESFVDTFGKHPQGSEQGNAKEQDAGLGACLAKYVASSTKEDPFESLELDTSMGEAIGRCVG